MKTLLNAEPVTSDPSLKELRRLYDTTESHLRSLRSLSVEPTSFGAMLDLTGAADEVAPRTTPYCQQEDLIHRFEH